MNIPAIDTHEFTRRDEAASGTVPIARLERLGSMLLSTEGELAWRLAGRSELGADGSRRGFLQLALRARPTMRCVRCLEPIAVELEALRDYRMVGSEAQAEREDADDDEHDLLVSSRQFDLAALVEDEAIMALPLAPGHADCRPPPVPAEDEGDAPDAAPDATSAFAALGALRRGDPTGGSGGGAGGDR
jgi:uncharacterized protein